MAKNIVICLDGTRNDNEKRNTNVHHIFGMVDKSTTFANYYPGIGIGGWMIADALDSILGRGLFRTMRAAFTLIHGNYQPGDQIFLFGFSRGAFAARHLAGMICRCGLGHPAEETFDKYMIDVRRGPSALTQQSVRFLGLFDCVPGNQIYLMKDKTLQRLNSPLLEPGITNFSHAVSRDEKRWSFAPIIFENGGQSTFHQSWFPGYHFDIGGDANPPLNAFALWWMLREAYAQGLALELIQCPDGRNRWTHHGRLGIKIGFMGVIDSQAPGHPSDYWTTRLGLQKQRASLPDAKLVCPSPDLATLDECPRGCGEDMFEFFLTPEGKRRANRLFGKHAEAGTPVGSATA